MNSSKALLTVTAFSLAMIACALTRAAPSPTPPPTDTPVPTATASETATPTPSPTRTPIPTPNRTATAAARASATQAAVVDLVGADLADLGYGPKDGALTWASERAEVLRLTTYSTHVWTPIADGKIVTDFVLKADVTWESTSGLAICGFWFRAESIDEDARHYKFQTLRLSGLPAWDVEYWRFNRFQANVTPGGLVLTTPYLHQDQGSTNTYLIAAQGNVATIEANAHRLGQVTINTLSEGLVAFYANQESGVTSCTFDNAWLWEPDAN